MVAKSYEYQHDGLLLEGFIAYDDHLGAPRPGVLIVPEWHGVSENACRRAMALAALGYVAFVADMYGKGVRPTAYADCEREAEKYRSDRTLMRNRVGAALTSMAHLTVVDQSRIAAIGYCFGGTTALELARSGAAVCGTVAFHASLDTPAPGDASNIRGPVLVLHGADDPVVPEPQVLEFQREMRAARVDWQFVSYGNAVHSFTNPLLPRGEGRAAAYSASADRRSWQLLASFLGEVFSDA